MAFHASPASAQSRAPLGLYPQREVALDEGWLSRAGEWLLGPWVRRAQRGFARPQWFARQVASQAMDDALNDSLDVQALAALVPALRAQLRQHGMTPMRVARSFALVQAMATKVLGMTPFHTQVQAAWLMLRGLTAEMNTGEGKTLTAALTAATAALAGRRVHVITANDYLAQRDAQTLGPLYAALGLRCASVVQNQSNEERRAGWQADITYCTHQIVVFDYLRDRMAMKGRHHELQLQLARAMAPAGDAPWLLRGLDFAIVDEADNILIDEARTPLVISAETSSATDAPDLPTAQQALWMAESMEAGQHYLVEMLPTRSVRLLAAGRAMLGEAAQDFGGVWHLPLRREELVHQALTAIHVFHRDEHYLVRDGKVEIIDAATGRVMPDRTWSEGLHQLVEVKEGCALSRPRQSLARISFQQFFRRYRHLCGMTGTASEVAGELGRVYQLPVARVAPLHASRQLSAGRHVQASEAEKWQAIGRRVAHWHALGNPVLVGTRTLAASEALARVLSDLGLPCTVLNARQDQQEAQIVAQAGQLRAITIATNMAGRGTDITLGPGVKALGGLVVLLTERHASARIDRQLMGRCARFGDPGITETFISLDDALFERLPAAIRDSLQWLGAKRPSLLKPVALALSRILQHLDERRSARQRVRLMQEDQRLQQFLAFSGEIE
ncbi:DEAD/DEAH box helicase [Limnohabitans planktonicus]|uniref:Uncharacterized protein n=1 Tax=Limnohabitans planktonicus II-D5 TaxID=1293045 RepID=A0A2T7UBZ3_9BURK|nr:DEAD/DEAH box helicase [Limnohabitans planktonicus]PVE42229.1 hypothetical protein H663_013200 [Limnohabitans planktonicus II-D5]